MGFNGLAPTSPPQIWFIYKLQIDALEALSLTMRAGLDTADKYVEPKLQYLFESNLHGA